MIKIILLIKKEIIPAVLEIKIEQTRDIIIIMPYSLKNKNTNINLPISTLKPLISSLSPSNRSKGARFVSIKESKSQIPLHKNSNSKEEFRLKDKVIVFKNKNLLKKNKIKETS